MTIESIPRSGIDVLAGGGAMGARMRAHDWSATPLGRPATWPRSLQTVVSLMLASRQAMFVAWGPELSFLYNDAYEPIFGARRPEPGQPFRVVWSDIWDHIRPLVERTLAGEASWHEDLLIPMERQGYREDAWFTFSYTPITGDDGRIAGIFCAAFETTRTVQSRRRTAFHLDFEARLRHLSDPRDVIAAAEEALGRHLGASRVGYGVVDGRARHFTTTRNWTDGTVRPQVGTHDLEAFGTAVVATLRRGDTLVIHDAATDPRTDGPEPRAAFAALETASLITASLVKGGRMVAALYVHDRRPRRWTADEVALVEEVAERTWSAVERADAQSSLRRAYEALEAERRAVEAANARLAAEGDRLRDLFRQAPGFMCVLRGPDHVFELANAAYFRLVGRRDIVGKPVRRALPEVAGQGFFELLDRVYQSGEPFVGHAVPVRIDRRTGGPPQERFVTFVYQPIFDGAGRVTGIFCEGSDVTEARLAEDALRTSEERLRVAQNAAGIGTFELRADGTLAVSEEFCRLWGVAPRPLVPLDELAAHIHPEDRPRLNTLQPGAPPAEGPGYAEYRIIRPDTGEVRWMARRGETMPPGEGRPVRVVGACYDITDRKRVEEELRRRSHDLEVINRTGIAVAAELDMERLVQLVTDGGVAVTGAEFGAFFYNVVGDDGERYMLYALSGAPQEAFIGFPMPRNTAVFTPTFAGDGIVRSDDITRDPRYGLDAPHHGMPAGHLPVRSYLAVPVTSRSGEVLGGLFFGHSQPGVFTDRSEESLAGLAAQAAVAMDNVRLFRAAQSEILQRRTAEEQLRQLNEQLEERVTAEIAVRRQAEDHLRQAQKLEAVGQLTGGVAHDFNNLLQALSGCLTMIGRRSQEAGVRPLLEAGQQAVDRGAKLVQQLMAFARRESLRPEPIDLRDRVLALSALLERALRADIGLETRFSPGLWPILVDPTQFELALINLAVNARDAMPGGGHLTVEARNLTLGPGDPTGMEGEFVRFSVTDTGTGMPENVRTKAFDPFFTTKEVGKGSGLGLAQVYGMARQAGGTAWIESAPGRGTTVVLLLRRSADRPAAGPNSPPAAAVERTAGRMLLVEDDPVVASTVAAALEDAGWTVVRVTTADDALPLLSGDEPIDLLFSDVVMPGRLSGIDLAREARALRPGLPVVLTTGYSEGVAEAPGVRVLGKPYRIDDLTTVLREALAPPGSGHEDAAGQPSSGSTSTCTVNPWPAPPTSTPRIGLTSS
ncbi:GAF domain-containing protein [Azospirillum halopraeferens]|uniref:GAF domain-containing protein n=1 Tax=Azospirillum halopraeferens TaxID=34010 RepID=UPI000428BDCD|nr:GAF domain-containing protein [Azospirillum halopraeferens]